jgi:hypothetical protein
MLADELDYVVGVDTHRDEHVLAVVAAATGAVLGKWAVRANAGGHQEALRAVGERARSGRAWAIEGHRRLRRRVARFLAELELGGGTPLPLISFAASENAARMATARMAAPTKRVIGRQGPGLVGYGCPYPTRPVKPTAESPRRQASFRFCPIVSEARVTPPESAI